MKQIAIFSPNYSPELGACSSRIRLLAEHLKQEGNQVTVYTTFPNYPTGTIFSSYRKFLFKKLIYKENIDGINVARFSFYPSNSSSAIIRLFSMMSLALSWLLAFPLLKKQQPQTILVQSPPLLPVFTVWILSKWIAKKNNIPTLILNLSDLYPRVLLDLDKIKGHTIYNLLLKFEAFLYKKMDFIIGQSDEIVEYVKKNVPSTPVVLYRNGVDSKDFKVKENYQIETKSPIKLVYAGLLGVVQGVLQMLENVDFDKLNAELHLYGNGNERKLIENFIIRNKKKNIFLHPAISQNEIAQKLADYDAAIVIQKKQILGTVPSKIYEAMAAGLPILLLGSGESAMLVKKYDVGLVVELSENKQTSSINYKLLSDKIRTLKEITFTQRKNFGQNGRKAAENIFDKKMQFKNIKTLFE